MAIDKNKPFGQEDLDYKDFVYQVHSAWLDEYPNEEVSLEDYLFRELWNAEKIIDSWIDSAT